MSRNTRDLRNVGVYFLVLAALASGLLIGGGILAERATASHIVATVVSLFEPPGERPPTRLSVNVENAREIRAALAKPMPPREPLPPITAKLAYGQLKNGRAVAMNATAQKITRVPKLPKAGLNAMASAATKSTPQAANVELHRVY